MAVNQTLLRRINEIQAEVEGELDLRSVATHRICEECETVAHCSRHGCIPKRPLVARDIGVEAALPSRFTNEPQPQDESAREPIDWQLVGVYAAAAAAFLWCLVLSIH